jgi:phosphatidylglycerophosphate synthase
MDIAVSSDQLERVRPMLARGHQTCKLHPPVRGSSKTMDRWRPWALGPLGSVLLVAVVLAGLAIATQQVLALSPSFPGRALAAFAVGSAVLLALARRHLPPGSFGSANQVTLTRGALLALPFGLLGEPALEPAAAHLAVAIGMVVLALDGLDGRLARREGRADSFGARFDMETDALMILLLAALVWQFDKAGPWVLLAGFMRYGFVAAAAVLPWLRRPLPGSRRRQAAFVLVALTLIACLAPMIVPPWSTLLALSGVALIGASFAVDVAWLARHNETPTGCAS